MRAESCAEKLRAVCGIPAEGEVVVCTPLGVPEAWPAPHERKAMATVFSGERYGRDLALPED